MDQSFNGANAVADLRSCRGFEPNSRGFGLRGIVSYSLDGLTVKGNGREVHLGPCVDATPRHCGAYLELFENGGGSAAVGAMAPHITVAVPRSMCSGLPKGPHRGCNHRDKITLIRVSDFKGVAGTKLKYRRGAIADSCRQRHVRQFSSRARLDGMAGIAAANLCASSSCSSTSTASSFGGSSGSSSAAALMRLGELAAAAASCLFACHNAKFGT